MGPSDREPSPGGRGASGRRRSASRGAAGGERAARPWRAVPRPGLGPGSGRGGCSLKWRPPRLAARRLRERHGGAQRPAQGLSRDPEAGPGPAPAVPRETAQAEDVTQALARPGWGERVVRSPLPSPWVSRELRARRGRSGVARGRSAPRRHFASRPHCLRAASVPRVLLGTLRSRRVLRALEGLELLLQAALAVYIEALFIH